MDKKYIVLGKSVEVLTQGSDGFYRDDFGCIWPQLKDGYSADNEVRAGIGWFSLPGFENEVRAHDFMYSSDVFQAYNTRAEADEVLYEHMRGSWLRRPFYWLSRLFGGDFWENKSTR